MRDIGFRAKRLDNGEWANGSGVLVADDFCVIDADTELYVDEKYEWAGATHFFRIAGAMCDKETICQFTGAHDCFGKNVYEGDIIKRVGMKRYGRVFYHKGCFYVGFPEAVTSLHTLIEEYDFVVVGNKFDNPNLLDIDDIEDLKILHLVLKHEWYDMIKSGNKEEEYRAICPYWIMRLMEHKNGSPISSKEAGEYAADIDTFCWIDTSDIQFKDYDAICFHRGYTKEVMYRYIGDMAPGIGRSEWGAPDNEVVFVIKLGSELL